MTAHKWKHFPARILAMFLSMPHSMLPGTRRDAPDPDAECNRAGSDVVRATTPELQHRSQRIASKPIRGGRWRARRRSCTLAAGSNTSAEVRDPAVRAPPFEALRQHSPGDEERNRLRVTFNAIAFLFRPMQW